MKFPTEREKFLREVSDYRGVAPESRIEAVFQLTSLCESIGAASPHRRRQIELLDRNEELEHQSWRDLISRHERRATVSRQTH